MSNKQIVLRSQSGHRPWPDIRNSFSKDYLEETTFGVGAHRSGFTLPCRIASARKSGVYRLLDTHTSSGASRLLSDQVSTKRGEVKRLRRERLPPPGYCPPIFSPLIYIHSVQSTVCESHPGGLS